MTEKEKLLRAAEAFIKMKTSIRPLGSEIDELDKSLLSAAEREEWESLEKLAHKKHPEVWASTERLPMSVVDDLKDFFEFVWCLAEINCVVQYYPEHRKELCARRSVSTGGFFENDISRAYHHLQWWTQSHDTIPTFARLKKLCGWGAFESDGVKYGDAK